MNKLIRFLDITVMVCVVQLTTAQSLTWVSETAQQLDALGGIYPMGSGISVLYNGGQQAVARTYDWQGGYGQNTEQRDVISVLPIQNGRLEIGHLNAGTTSIGGFPVQVGTASREMYIIRHDSTGQALWLAQTTSLTPSSPVVTNSAAAPDGTCVVMVHTAMSFVFDGDTLPLASGNADRILLVDPQGNLVWYRSIEELYGLGFDSRRSNMAIASDGSVWVAAHGSTAFWIGTDTILPAIEYGQNHVILRFDATGQFTDHIQVPGTYDRSIGGGSLDLLAWDNGEILWAGWHADSTVIGGDTLFTAGGSDGLLLHFDDQLNILDHWRLATEDNDMLSALGRDPLNGAVLVSGFTENGALFSGTTILGGHDRVLFLARLDMSSSILDQFTEVAGCPASSDYQFAYINQIVASEGPIHLYGIGGLDIVFSNGTPLSPYTGYVARIDRADALALAPKEASFGALDVWPSPCSGQLFFRIPENSTVSEVLNSIGQVIERYPNKPGSIDAIQEVNVANLQPGVYFLRIRGISGAWCSAFVKE